MATEKSRAKHSQGLLLFRLDEHNVFGLGTLKIKELIPVGRIFPMVKQTSGVLGVINYRHATVPVIDLAGVLGMPSLSASDQQQGNILITDVQRKMVGLLIRKVERIVDIDWRDIMAPHGSLGRNIYITGVVQLDKQIVQLLDVEVIMNRLFPPDPSQAVATITDVQREQLKPKRILLVDDSRAARKQLSDALDAINVPYEVTDNGEHALRLMRERAEQSEPVDILVSDIEMPGLDGYELTFAIRDDARLKQAYVILHTSLSSEISVSQAHQVGADEALTKFDARELIDAMLRGATGV